MNNNDAVLLNQVFTAALARLRSPAAENSPDIEKSIAIVQVAIAKIETAEPNQKTFTNAMLVALDELSRLRGTDELQNSIRRLAQLLFGATL